MSNDSCGAPAGGVTITKDKAGKEAIVEGRVLRGGDPVATGYARLLGTGDEFMTVDRCVHRGVDNDPPSLP